MSEQHYDCPCMEKCPLHHAMQLIGGKWKVLNVINKVCGAVIIFYGLKLLYSFAKMMGWL